MSDTAGRVILTSFREAQQARGAWVLKWTTCPRRTRSFWKWSVFLEMALARLKALVEQHVSHVNHVAALVIDGGGRWNSLGGIDGPEMDNYTRSTTTFTETTTGACQNRARTAAVQNISLVSLPLAICPAVQLIDPNLHSKMQLFIRLCLYFKHWHQQQVTHDSTAIARPFWLATLKPAYRYTGPATVWG